MRYHRHTAGFTLVEMLVVAALIVILMTVLVSMTNQTQRLITSTSSKIEQFQEARVAFESMTRKLAQATLNTFWDYDYPLDASGLKTDNSLPPLRYQRWSDLRFRTGPMPGLGGLNPPSGIGQPSLSYPGGNPQVGVGVMFHAPFGVVSDQTIYGALDTTINTWGYFNEIGDDSTSMPAFISTPAPAPAPPLIAPRRRYRLMELMVPTEELRVFQPTAQVGQDRSWYLPFINGTTPRTRVLSENIVLFLVLPRLTATDEKAWQALIPTTAMANLAKNYVYDSSILNFATDETYGGTNYKTVGWLNPKHQLPPVLQVIMVAIDELSAQRLDDKYKLTNPAVNAVDVPGMGITLTSGASQIYNDPTSVPPQLFTSPLVLEDTYTAGVKTPGDLSKFEAMLQAQKISYRIFSSRISVLGAKWSRAQNQ